MRLAPAARLGVYEIVSPLGAGGMGEVYRARDTRLQRDVAVKVLSAHLDTDPDSLDRFQREARAIAALNHPNIVTIYTVEEFDGGLFLAMEFLDGRTLADLLPSGGLPLDALLRYGIPLADALAAAHAQGVTHRDLKPANVMITKDGRLKVLDFGLAKLRDEGLQADATLGPTRPITERGTIVGTVAYMSPEQASGGAVDSRSDLFSVGVMLYEMATGGRPFAGDSSVSILASILKDTPKPVTDSRPQLPRELARIVRRALAKDPEQRYQTAKDLRNDLQALSGELASGALDAPPASRVQPAAATRRIAASAIVAAATIVAAIVYVATRRSIAPTGDTGTISRLTATGKASLAAISPDGKYVVHVVNDGGYSLWIRQTATTSNVQIVPSGPDRYVGLAFSPDGDYVYFTRFETRLGSNVYRIPILGGTPQPVITDVDGPVSFSPDGTRVAFLRGVMSRNEVQVMIARADGSGERVRLAARAMSSGYPLFTRAAWSPDGRTIAVATGVQTWVGGGLPGGSALIGIDVASGRERVIASGRWDTIANITWLADGSLVVSGTELGRPNHQLWRVSPADGSMRRVTNDLNTYPDVSAAARAPIIVTVLGDLSSTISISAPDDPGALHQITSGAGRYDGQTGVAWTPDGRLVFPSAAAGQTDLWIMDGDGRNARQLTTDAATERMVDVTPDGASAVFVADRAGQPGIWRLTFADGRVTRLTDNIHDLYPFCRRDSRSILFTRYEPEPHLYRLTFGEAPVRIATVNDLAVAASPDGKAVATLSVVRRPVAIGVADLEGRGETARYDILNAPLMVAWTPRGDALTFLESRKGAPGIWNQPMAGGEPRPLLTLLNQRIFSFAWSRDGRLAVAHGPVPTDVVLITGTK